MQAVADVGPEAFLAPSESAGPSYSGDPSSGDSGAAPAAGEDPQLEKPPRNFDPLGSSLDNLPSSRLQRGEGIAALRRFALDRRRVMARFAS